MNNNSCIERNESQTGDLTHVWQPETIVVINCAFNVPLILVSITTNTLVLAAILRTPSLYSPSIVFLCFLATSDLLVGFVAQPLYIAAELKLSPLLQNPMIVLTSLLCGVSVFIMAAISVDRLIALHYHLRYPDIMSKQRAVYTSVTLLLISIVSSFLRFWGRTAYFVGIAVAIAICIIISTFSYIQIFRIVRHHHIQIHTQQQAVQSENDGKDKNMTWLKKSCISTFIYYMCMILCYSPLFMSMLVLAISGKQDTKAWRFADTFAFMNSSINPFLYCWRLTELRAAVLRTIRHILCKCSGEN